MDINLEERIRYHSYDPNPVVSDYLSEQRRRSQSKDFEEMREQITVRERHSSGVSVASGHSRGEDAVDGHDRCMTPVPDNKLRHELQCVICLSLAINPFRCTAIDEGRDATDNQSKSAQIYHICCYQCLAQHMITLRTHRFSCPYCQKNEFNWNNLVYPDNHVIEEGQHYLIHCPNNCGLMGSPLALAHHICAFQDPQYTGHTTNSNVVHNLLTANRNLNMEVTRAGEEVVRLKAELAHVLHNNMSGRTRRDYWRREFYHLQDSLNREHVRSELITNVNARLRHRIEEMDHMIKRLQEEKTDAIKRCKSNLKKVAKYYKTRVLELSAVNERLSNEFRDLIDMSVSETVRRPRSGSSPADSSDEQSLGFPSLFAIPPLNSTATDEGIQTVYTSSDEESLHL